MFFLNLILIVSLYIAESIILIPIIKIVGDIVMGLKDVTLDGYLHSLMDYNLISWILDSLSINLIRFMLYGIVQLILFLIFNEILNLNSKRLKLAMINCGSYIFISVLIGLCVRDLRDLFRILFPALVLTTFLSPFVLYQIPFARKLIRRVVR